MLPQAPQTEPTPEQIKKAKQNPHLVCDNCGHYPLQPMHGHYVCSVCAMPTKCCEGAPCEI